jgi:phage terminase large subunit-like protein
MISNIVIERNHKNEIYPRKAGGKDSANKIDGAIAFFTALSRAMRVQEDPQPLMVIVGSKR